VIADYSTVTEVPGRLVSGEAIDMACTRYLFAGAYCKGKATLEVACGPGPGLGYLGSLARRLVAGDCTASLIDCARARYAGRVPLVRLDATSLPFGQASFDVIVLFEAIYFLPNVDAFLESCREVLTAGGLVLVASVNPEWNAFNPSPGSTMYWTADALARVFRAHRFVPELYAGFPAEDGGVRDRLMTLVKRAAVELHLIPKTMKGKEWLKRLVFGKLDPFPEELSCLGSYQQPVRLAEAGAVGRFKVLYAVARKEDN
jgi:SAM-dependent methyltransferase